MSLDLSSSTLAATVAGLTRMLVVVLLAPGVIAGAVAAGVLALVLLPLLLLVNPGRRSGVWIAPFMPMRSPTASSRSAASS